MFNFKKYIVNPALRCATASEVAIIICRPNKYLHSQLTCIGLYGHMSKNVSFFISFYKQENSENAMQFFPSKKSQFLSGVPPS